MQQLQNNCALKPCGSGTDDGVVGEVESTDGNAFIRGTSRIQERQEYSPPDLDSEAICRESKTTGTACFNCFIDFQKTLDLIKHDVILGNFQVRWNWKVID